MGEVALVRTADAHELVLLLVCVEVLVSRVHFFDGLHPHAIVVQMRLVRGLGGALVNDEFPLGIGVLYRRLSGSLPYDIERQQVGEHRQGIVQGLHS